MEWLEVAEISIDGDGRLLIRPREVLTSFAYVHRAAAEVGWDEGLACFACPTPREWPYSRWYQQARDAVRGEFGLEFTITDRTAWTNVTDSVREGICAQS